MIDAAFLQAFEDCTVPRAEWTHAAHIRMARLYCQQLPFAMALERIRNGIRRYNDSLGGTGYHETITVAFAILIASRMEVQEARGFADFERDNPDLFAKLTILDRHYSAALLGSPTAKERLVPPDREPLPILKVE